MAFHANTEWDVRTTGNDANGGGFQVGSTGTDRSQQDAAYIAFTDLVIDHTTNTKITSSANPFDATSVGNVINITGGTGFTVQRVQIVSVASAVATCDKAVGTIDSTGGTGNLGGAVANFGTISSLMVNGNTAWIQTGTYTITATYTIGSNMAGNALGYIRGYVSTHGDATAGDDRPLITSATDSVVLITLSASSNPVLTFRDLRLSHTADTRGDGISRSTGSSKANLQNVTITGCRDGLQVTNNAIVRNSEFGDCTRYGLNVSHITAFGNYIYGCATSGVNVAAAANNVDISRNLIVGNAVGVTTGALQGGCPLIADNTIALNTSHALSLSDETGPTVYDLENNIIYGNGGYGVNAAATCWVIPGTNAFGDNDSGDWHASAVKLVAGSDIALSADPFTDSANDDYSLNNDAGGGAACRNAGFQWGV